MARCDVAVWQMAPTLRDPQANLARLESVATEARERGAGLLVAPELALTGADVGELTPAMTDPALLDELCAIARRTDLGLVVGLALAAPAGTASGDAARHNSSVIIDAAGQCHATHRKAHLFGDLDLPLFTPGQECFAMAELGGVTVATMVCYDVEFPEPARAAALAGADIIAVPTANMYPWTIVSEHVIPTRAFENQCVVAYANHHGWERETHFMGRSVIAAPDGRVVRAAPDREELLVLPVDTDELARCRAEVTYLRDRRPELYAALADPAGS